MATTSHYKYMHCTIAIVLTSRLHHLKRVIAPSATHVPVDVLRIFFHCVHLRVAVEIANTLSGSLTRWTVRR